ncbi:LOW QUALITY PROTEIN: hypothetical protein CVT26_010899 [Gymnopilus dilepis]|uniref:Uncharacterized protein n=1 Tax=Gymnopilus dilepis TaxID=231916 RepID=A0A409WSN4_9AGAR|nr:LOW QUALITY PROTEIN: hypothetical protein CVT26_010899 [Gymnopilus dilepis]
MRYWLHVLESWCLCPVNLQSRDRGHGMRLYWHEKLANLVTNQKDISERQEDIRKEQRPLTYLRRKKLKNSIGKGRSDDRKACSEDNNAKETRYRALKSSEKGNEAEIDVVEKGRIRGRLGINSPGNDPPAGDKASRAVSGGYNLTAGHDDEES